MRLIFKILVAVALKVALTEWTMLAFIVYFFKQLTYILSLKKKNHPDKDEFCQNLADLM